MLSASWIIQGVVQELRELKSQKNAEWRGYVVKVASLGQTFEVHVTATQFTELQLNDMLECRGHFEAQGRDNKFVLDKYSKQQATKAA